MGARLVRGIDYTTAYGTLPLPVAVLQGGVEVYRNSEANGLPFVAAVGPKGDLIEHDGKWYWLRESKLSIPGAVAVTWRDVTEAVRIAHVLHILTEMRQPARATA